MNTNYLKFRLLNILMLLLIGTRISNAQQLQASLSHYNMDNGLCSNSISCIIQDSYGYIWLGTWNGLSRFDGFSFHNYTTGSSSDIPLLHNRVIDMVTDASQNIWMRMYDGRIFMLNRLTDKIENPMKNIMGYEKFKTKYPLKVTSKGEIMAIIQDVGIYRMKYTNTGISAQLITTDNVQATSIVEGYKNELIIGTDKGVYRLDEANKSSLGQGFLQNEHISCMYSNGYNIYCGTRSGKIIELAYGQEPRILKSMGKRIYSVFKDSHGMVWFSMADEGIMRLRVSDGNMKEFRQKVLFPEYDLHGANVVEVGGTLWINMAHGGFGYYNRQADTMEYFHNNPDNPWDLSNTVACYLALPEGVVWESTSRRGLEKLEILKKTILRTPLFPNQPNNENEVRAMYYDREKDMLLLGNKLSSLILIKDGKRTVLHDDGKGNEFGRIYGISKDHEGNYWIASKSKGLFKMSPNGSGYSFMRFSTESEKGMRLNSNAAYKAIEDKHGNIWLATYDGGVNLITRGADGKYTVLNKDNGFTNYPKNAYDKVRTLVCDKNGNVWAGSTDGILIVNYTNKKLNIETVDDNEDYDDNLRSKDVICLARDANGTIWVGTNGGGLSCCKGKNKKGEYIFETYGYKQGLPSEEIKSITFDNRGNVWFATDHILCSFDVRRQIFSIFTFQDGVDDTICSEDAAITLPNGNILIGTLNGYYSIDRSRISNYKGSALKLRITDFMINDELMSPRLNDTYDYYVPDSRSVELPSHSSVFSFRFAALNYQLQHRVHYQYMLEGYDKEWKNADKSRMVSYSNLPTGTFNFKVKAFLLESPEKFDIRSISVVVPPHFLLSSAAIWIYMIIIAGIILTILYLRQERLAKLEKMRVLKVGPQDIAFKEDGDYKFMQDQLDWLEKHYSQSDMKIEDMVANASLSRTSYYNQLKSLTGQSPKEFITDFRLKKAAMYLENSNNTIAEIAYNTGFNDPVYFTRIFKQKMGVTPSKFRENKQKSKSADSDVTKDVKQAEDKDLNEDKP